MTSATAPREPAQYVTIGIDREVFAIEVGIVREILDLQPITRLPHAPPFLVGMIDVRGQGVPTVDLRVKLGLPAVPPTANTRIIVLDVPQQGQEASLTVGVVADRVFEVTSLDGQDLETPPQVGGRWRSDCIQAIGRSNGTFVIVFDIARLFAQDDVALLTVADAA
ncbi:purine-binding chemotaxis protein CheW [Azospirillum lipoferum]|uniref:Chemotaxis protein CheW n=1 Tax=Azospirillum lipoferum TaxID=193 RepID=A0A5A9GMK9_AZOLI|nr:MULTISPECIES: chemotaxis protein CheW [Azospirillum]KAA0594824.1 chemotaxis protein CheW [Azospirillum lipoferum]MCP1612850.1 purine-binding chemotaxis protein CheW [Azospirillum lipoferum]MDW5532011.1 chemotaxis protein CheW [Azospirillum sp. NL1]